LAVEFLITIDLAFLVVKVATVKGKSGNFSDGLAIGLAVMQLVNLSQVWLHIAAAIAGGRVGMLIEKRGFT